jgi:alpha-mannosidase
MRRSWKEIIFVTLFLVLLLSTILGMKYYVAFSAGISSNIKYLFVVELSHLDIGFTASPDTVAQSCKTIIDHAIFYCNHNQYYKWTIESIWQLENWIERSNQSEINQLITLVKSGRISIAAGYANMHTGDMGSEEMNEFLYPAQHLRNEWNITIDSIIQDDVPGYSWDLPQVLAKSEVEYLVTGINTGMGGGTSIPMSNIPFYWQGPDGSRVLTWISFDAYVEGLTTYGLTDMATAYSKLSQKLPALEAAGYPYDAVLVLRGFDNADTNLNMVNLAIQWNATYDNPKIILATPDMFFHYIEQKYGNNFPTYSGDWAGYWDMLSITQPQSITKNRWSHDNVVTAEKISSINSLMGTQTYPIQDFTSIYNNMMEFDEHNTGGAPWPRLMTPEEAYKQNQILCGYADTAYNMTSEILGSGLKELTSNIKSANPFILVFNPLSWNVTGLARVKLGDNFYYTCSFVIVDPNTGKNADYEFYPATQELIFLAENVPPIGYKRYDIVTMRLPHDPNSVYIDENVIGNQFYRITIDKTNGYITSIYDEEAKRELVNPSSKFGFKFNEAIESTKNQYLGGLYTVVPTGTCEIATGLNGPVAKSLVVNRYGSPFIKTEITLYSNIKRIEIINTMNRSLMQHVSYNTGYAFYMYAFPFNLTDYKVKLEIANAFMTPIDNNLPGAAIPDFTIQHGLSMSEPNYTITFGNNETFVNYFGRIQWYTTTFNPYEPTIISNFLKKEDEAQYKDGSIGPIEQEPGESPILMQSYSISTNQSSFSQVDTTHSIWESSNSLLAVVRSRNLYGTLENSSMSFFGVNSSSVMIVNVKKADFGEGFIVRLLELSGLNSTVEINSFFNITQAKLANMVEQDLENLPVENGRVTVDINAYETLTVRLEF